MMERRAILDLWERIDGEDDAVIAAVVAVEGSSYRRPGARLLAGGNGARAGSVSGGCLEAEVLRKAKWLTAGGPVLRRYSTFFDDSTEIPYGLGCGGAVELLLERVSTAEGRALRSAMSAALRGRKRVVATVLPGDDGPMLREVWDEGGHISFSSADLAAGDLMAAVADAKSSGTLQIELAGRKRRMFLEFMEAQPSLYLFGAGDDAKPLADLAGRLGWHVTVSDRRADLAGAERFAVAQVKTLEAGSLNGFQFHPRDAAVIMTHNYVDDRAWLTALLPVPLRYLGLLGARSRSRTLIEEAAAALGWSLEECLRRLHAPTGLDLGGDGPEAVALAIVAEIHAHLEGRAGRSRSMGLDELMAAVPAERRECPR